MARLNYSGDATENSKADVQALIGSMIDVDVADNGLNVDSVSVRLDGTSARIIISVSAQGTVAELETLADTIANGAVNLGLEPDVETARASVEISGGLD